jgi:tRNA (guanine37-N1)-methyltransferase
MDKNPVVRTVINKVDDVGAESVFRTFSYEVLAGPDDLNVEIKEEDCTFRFDYSKVYWNSRLNTEHRRLVGMFKAGEVVVDVMAGVGPFAVPAGKKGVFVWANDLNPSSIESMRNAIRSNKVEPFVRAYNVDGHKFIHQATAEVLELAEEGKNTVEIPGKRTKSMSRKAPPPPSTHVTIPSTVSHFVMNLPASALTFLPSYRGIYHGKEHQFEPHTDRKLPMVHVHCFSTKSEDNMKEGYEITGIVNEMLGTSLKFEGNVERSEGDTKNKSQAKGEVKDGEVRVHDVRDVAPLKRMFCASFRIPPEVAFAKPAEEMAKPDAL